jgi:hypothetical protein
MCSNRDDPISVPRGRAQKTAPEVSVLIAFRKLRQSESEPRLWICGSLFSQVVSDFRTLGYGGLEVFDDWKARPVATHPLRRRR